MGTTETCQTPIYGLASRVVLRGSKWKPHCGYFRRSLCPANAHTSSAIASAKHATPHHEKPPVQPVPLSISAPEISRAAARALFRGRFPGFVSLTAAAGLLGFVGLFGGGRGCAP